MPTQWALKYLFTAHYSDGTSFQQTIEDVSTTREGGSAFTDVDHSQLESFQLSGLGNDYLVNLLDGHFEVNGVSFWVGEELPSSSLLKLIFWRTHRHIFTLGREELSHTIEYVLGWETEIDGKTYKQTISID